MNLSILPSFQRTWLLILLALWATFLFGGFIFGSPRENRRMPRWTRMVSSFILTIAGWSWRLAAAGSGVEMYATLMAAGVTFGFIGDLFLARLISRSLTKSTLGGIGAFAIGHLFYISGILFLLDRFSLHRPGPVWGSLIFFWLAALGGWYALVMRGQSQPSILHWAALPYAMLLAATAGLALGAGLQQPLLLPLALGAFLFLLSDMILAGAMFGDLELPLHHDIVWLTYGPGQMLIVFSIGAAMQMAL